MLPGDQLVCAFVEPLPVGSRFTAWPLHVTLVPWFRLTVSLAEFEHCLQESLKSLHPFATHAGSARRFGARRASALEKQLWQPLHEAVLECVRKNAYATAPLRFVGKRFQPHITFQKSGHLAVGERFACNQVYVIEQKGAYKEVISVVGLEQ